ncbi:glycoside hydrolase family 172 protein [Olivibacter sp. XZL3]|uniref:glycoside hydrolase family 172 protein n=1 Tax=Olivibacter sp. XZL3 TaxID=1735116 RepID=UPI001417066F|nr:glycoside hydrolase family 172 protein [Olivibacter sp. XZL3]
MKIKIVLLICTGLGVFARLGHCQHVVNMANLLKEMRDFEQVARFPEPIYTLKQASSYDRRSTLRNGAGWFANSDFNQFIRREEQDGRVEHVMMDAEGPGAIVRFWLTCLEKPGTMRFYFDHEKEPTITVPGFDLLKAGLDLGPALLNPHTNYDPKGKGGNTLYLPLVYNKHCKVTWEFADSADLKKPHYYQINYRTYPKDTKAETFSFEQLEQVKDEIKDTENILWHPSVNRAVTDSIARRLNPSEECMVELRDANQAIRLLQVQLADLNRDKEVLWRKVTLKISFDNRETVSCPLGDFIGSGYGGNDIASWYRALADKKTLTSHWVMPFRESAVVRLINNNDFPIELTLSIATDRFEWDKRAMYFHAFTKMEEQVWDAKWDYDPKKSPKGDARAPIDWNFIEVKGEGVYMGNTLATLNHMNSWYGEGDAKAYVDGEDFPSEFGTGLEDYYNTSWAPVIIYQTPFANATRADHTSSTGHNTFTRTRILDAIPFKKSFSYDMEMLSWDGGYVDIAATTYWYAKP